MIYLIFVIVMILKSQSVIIITEIADNRQHSKRMIFVLFS